MDRQTLASCPLLPQCTQVLVLAGQVAASAQCCDEPQRKHAFTRVDGDAEEPESEVPVGEGAVAVGEQMAPVAKQLENEERS